MLGRTMTIRRENGMTLLSGLFEQCTHFVVILINNTCFNNMFAMATGKTICKCRSPIFFGNPN